MDDASWHDWMIAHPVITDLAGLAVIIIGLIAWRVPAVRRVLRLLLFLPVSAALGVLGTFMLVLWRPVRWLTGLLLYILPLDRWLANLPARWTANAEDRLVQGQREAVARSVWPEEQYPELYRKVPPDIVRPLYEDGRLIGGVPVPWLGDRHMTEATQVAAARIGAESAVLVVLLGLILPLLAILIDLVSFGADFIGGNSRPVIDAWPGTEPVLLSYWAMLSADLHVSLNMLTHDLVRVVAILPGTLLFAAGVAMLTFIAMTAIWYQRQAAPYRLVTKDADVRWAYRAEIRDTLRRTYRRQVEHATGYLKDAKTFKVGTATGVLRVRGDLAAPSSDQPVMLDSESLFQHTIVFGGTGEGKTTALLKPIMRQVWADKKFGSFVADAKGVLWKDAVKVATDLGRAKDLVVIGTGEGQKGVNVIEGLTPSQVVSVIRSVMNQMAGGEQGSFWSDMASIILRHTLTIGLAFAETKEGQEIREQKALHPYSLWWAYQAILRPDDVTEAIEAVRKAHGIYKTPESGAKSAPARGVQPPRKSAPLPEEKVEISLRDDEDDVPEPPSFKSSEAEQAEDAAPEPEQSVPSIPMSPELAASISYLEVTWKNLADTTRTGIIANLTQILDGFGSSSVLLKRFACGLEEDTVTLDGALDGRILVNALSAIEDGLAARLASILIKTKLYRSARLREAAWRAANPPRNPQDWPCLVVMDEVQELVTADPASGLSDATFWNVARSSGLAGLFATQTISALTMAVGKEAADNFLQQARSKVFFRVEEKDTIEYACWCAGAYERNRVVEDEHRESVEHRLLLDGWSPFAPLPDDSNLVFGPRALFGAAGALLQADGASFALSRSAPYQPDARFIPKSRLLDSFSGGGDQSLHLAQLGAQQAAAWRAEDLNRNYRMHGNEVQPALTPADMLHMGRWHAFAQIQRAGALRQDIIVVEHDFA